MNDPIVQNRRAVGDGGERVIPPARTQCLSKSTRDLLLRAARKPRVTAIIASVSDLDVRQVGGGGVQLILKSVGVCKSMATSSGFRSSEELSIAILNLLIFFNSFYPIFHFFSQSSASVLGLSWLIKNTATVAAGPGVLCLV